MLEDGSGTVVVDVRDSVGAVLTVHSVELRGWVVRGALDGVVLTVMKAALGVVNSVVDSGMVLTVVLATVCVGEVVGEYAVDVKDTVVLDSAKEVVVLTVGEACSVVRSVSGALLETAVELEVVEVVVLSVTM